MDRSLFELGRARMSEECPYCGEFNCDTDCQPSLEEDIDESKESNDEEEL